MTRRQQESPPLFGQETMMDRKRDLVDWVLVAGIGLCAVVASAILAMLVVAVVTGNVSNRDVCEWRRWGHCTSRW